MIFKENLVIEMANRVLQLGKDLKYLSIKQDFKIEIKEDKSSVTSADLYSDTEIKNIIKNIFKDTLVLSEEDSLENQEKIIKNQDYFIIDPIDGTDSFISGDDFCINIAYCKNNIPIFGMVALPMQNLVYFTMNNGIYCLYDNNLVIQLKNNTLKKDKINICTGKKTFSIEKSKNKFDNFIKTNNYKIDNIFIKNAGIKYLSTIIGISDITINFGKVKDWDLAPFFAMSKILNVSMTDSDKNEIIFGKSDMLHKNGILLLR